ncbi:MAG: cobyric acid synthase CobQ, partial [Butyrivibrio sp.]|nr:cobyric acid synthase CobQ [Butyrivibrio sp.]
LEKADMVIIPGSKNTIGDLKWVRESGMEAAIKRFALKGPVIGICGGFQMLGDKISDPYEVEEGGSIRGIGLLPLKTVLSKQKNRSQSRGLFPEMDGIYKNLSNLEYTGYEIHMGETVTDRDEKVSFYQKGNIFGTYVHGIFDEGELALKLAGEIANIKGMSLVEAVDYQQFKQNEYDKLAQIVRDNLDMDFIYKIMG